MAEGGRRLGAVLQKLRAEVRPGVTTLALDHAARALAGQLHERDVAGVQRAHGWHERDRIARRAPLPDTGAERVDGFDDLGCFHDGYFNRNGTGRKPTLDQP